jgi:two-component system, sensor histidine kinase
MHQPKEGSMLSIPPELARSALDASPDAMVIIDASGVIRFANKQVSAVFGYTHDEIIGRNVEMLMPERFRIQHVGHREHYISSVRVRPMGAGLRLYGRRQDASEFPLEISLSPIEHAGGVLIAAAIRDTTERRQAEIELINAREAADAARLQADQARALADQARESADRANQGKSRFLATASHDLRQPLQTLAFINGALSRVVSDTAVRDALAQQDQAINAMSRLLNALLDISKLESGAIKPEPADFRVAALFEELRAEFSGIAASKGLELQFDPCQDTAHSDPSLVEQILRNLVSNAIKYTREGWVRLRCLHEAALIRIEVLDSGIGIPAEQLPYICDEFYQVGVSTNTSREGYGLGLNIVQRLVNLLTLKLDVHSEVGRGSAFSLLLPASGAQPAPMQGDSGHHRIDEPQIGSTHVLLVEDDAAVRAATSMLLKVEGYRVTAVASLSEALEHGRGGRIIDLLVTDYHLGNGELGTQVIAALRLALARPLKAVLMTGDTSSAMKALPRDPNLRIASKPINADELLMLLRALRAA